MSVSDGSNSAGHCSSEYIGDIVFALPDGGNVNIGVCKNDKTEDGMIHFIISGVTRECLQKVLNSLPISYPSAMKIDGHSQMISASVGFYDNFCPMYKGADAVTPELLKKMTTNGEVRAVLSQVLEKAMEIIDNGHEPLTLDIDMAA